LVPDRSHVLLAESLFHEPRPEPGATARAELTLDTCAYVLFTSGSTGRPKGIAMPHRGLAHLIAWQNRSASGTVTGPTLQFAPLSFDVAFQEIWSTLCAGRTLQLITEAERHDMHSLLRVLDAGGVERLFLPYVALQQLAEAAVALHRSPRALRV